MVEKVDFFTRMGYADRRGRKGKKKAERKKKMIRKLVRMPTRGRRRVVDDLAGFEGSPFIPIFCWEGGY